MSPHETTADLVVREFYRAIGPQGRIPDGTDLAAAGELIELHGGAERVLRLIPAVARRAKAGGTHCDIGGAGAWFNEQSTREREQRKLQGFKEQTEQARIDERRDMEAWNALTRSERKKRMEARRAACPLPGPETFDARLVGRDARRQG